MRSVAAQPTLANLGVRASNTTPVENPSITFDSPKNLTVAGPWPRQIQPTTDPKTVFSAEVGNLCLGMQKYCFLSAGSLNLQVRNPRLQLVDRSYWGESQSISGPASFKPVVFKSQRHFHGLHYVR